MSTQIVECIPNFSEARRVDVIAEITQAIQNVPGIQILDRHSDMDHNRTVITFIGSPQAVEEGAFQAISRAAKLIDLNVHRGAHPRIGATDVLPFVPVSGISMQECVEIAKRLGQRVGDELNIPVYLYEEAATQPDRHNLENIRHGQYEGLKEEIKTNPARNPDYGPAYLGPAGATVIGARHPLVAFNVFLTTADVNIAQKIARVVRSSSGGLRYVKALGLFVDGRGQVSMNLTNYHQSSLARVVEMIRREAARYGVGIHHSELVGLIPQDALVESAQWYLQLDDFEGHQILENRLYHAFPDETQPEQPKFEEPNFLDRLAAGTATPGGGSASAYTGAAAAALVAMGARLTMGNERYRGVEDRMRQVISRAEEIRGVLTEAVDRDAAAYASVIAAYQLPKDTPVQREGRSRVIAEQKLQASAVPLEVARLAVEVMSLAVESARDGNITVQPDIATGLFLAQAALKSSAVNVRVNLRDQAGKPEIPQKSLDELAALSTQAEMLAGEMESLLWERNRISSE